MGIKTSRSKRMRRKRLEKGRAKRAKLNREKALSDTQRGNGRMGQRG